jgi:hypothetical protein
MKGLKTAFVVFIEFLHQRTNASTVVAKVKQALD